jgi:hypothetical protein
MAKVDKTKLREQIIVKSLKSRAAKPIKKIKALKAVKNNDQNVVLMDNTKLVKQLVVEAKTEMKEIIDPILGSVARIKDLFKPFIDEGEAIIAESKDKSYKFLEQSNKKKVALLARYTNGELSGASLMKQQSKLDVDTGSSSLRKVFTLIEVDAKKTPKQYLIPNETAIREALKEGKKVAGWEWKQVDNIAI